MARSVEQWKKYVENITVPIENLHSDPELHAAMITWMVNNRMLIMHRKEALLLYEYASKVDGLIVEFGTHRAGSAVVLGLSDINNSSRVYSFDIVQNPNNAVYVEHFGCHCNLIQMDSHKAGEQWDKGKVDLLFIDGCHTHEYAYQDMCIWSEHLNRGCYMLIHDYPLPRKQMVRCKRKEKRWKRRKLVDSNAELGSNNTRLNVLVAVNRFLKNHDDFDDVGHMRRIKILRKK